MPTDIDEFLAHHGVLGMKWGKRKAQIKKTALNATKGRNQDAKTNSREARAMKSAKNFDSRGKDLLKRSGGSKTLANSKIVGRTAAIGVLTNIGGTLIAGSFSKPEARLAAALGTHAVNALNLTYGLRDITTVSIQPKKK